MSKHERKLLRSGEAIRIGWEVVTYCNDIDEWKDPPPPDATMQYRCERAWHLKMYWTKARPSFNFWATYIEPHCLVQDWDASARAMRDCGLACMQKLEEGERRNANRRRWRDRSAKKPQRNARKRWRKVREYVLSRVLPVVRSRAIVAFWCDSIVYSV